MKKYKLVRKLFLFLLILTLVHGFAACGSQQANDKKPSSSETHDEKSADVDNCTFARDAVYYTVTYDDNVNQFDFIFGTIADKTSDSFLSDVEINVLTCAKEYGVELESDFMSYVAVEEITDEKQIDELKKIE